MMRASSTRTVISARADSAPASFLKTHSYSPAWFELSTGKTSRPSIFWTSSGRFPSRLSFLYHSTSAWRWPRTQQDSSRRSCPRVTRLRDAPTSMLESGSWNINKGGAVVDGWRVVWGLCVVGEGLRVAIRGIVGAAVGMGRLTGWASTAALSNKGQKKEHCQLLLSTWFSFFPFSSSMFL